jgi:NitT/TauT family transport system substrate-binding protein
MTTSWSARLSKVAATVALTWNLAACTPTPVATTPAPAPLDLKVGMLPGTAGAPIIVPALEGQFAARGLNISLEPVTDTTQAMISVATGQYDMAIVTIGPAALNVLNRGADVKIIAAGAAQPPGHGDNLPLVVRSQLIDAGVVKTAADLKGRKVAVNVTGANADYKLARAFATVNLTPADVDEVAMPFPDMVVALSTGAIDAGLVLQPTAAQAVARGVGKILLDDFDQNGQGGLLVVNSRFLGQHRDALATFLVVYLQEIRRFAAGKIKTDDQALEALESYTHVPSDLIRLGPDPYWPADGHVVIESVRDQQNFYVRNKYTDYGEALDVDKLIDYGPLDAALKDLGD